MGIIVPAGGAALGISDLLKKLRRDNEQHGEEGPNGGLFLDTTVSERAEHLKQPITLLCNVTTIKSQSGFSQVFIR